MNSINEMVNRFLSWSLPEDFCPDGGISFTKPEHPHPMPIGTNLFTAQQAEAMLMNVINEQPVLCDSCNAIGAAYKIGKEIISMDYINEDGTKCQHQPAENSIFLAIEREDLIDMIRWAYMKLQSYTYTKQYDALMLDRMKQITLQALGRNK